MQTLDKKSIKALSSDTRLTILRSLSIRRKMPSELSRELKLSSPTIIEHLKKLENAGLVEKKETGHKWIYYELTFKGTSVIKPKFPVQFVLMLSLGLILIIGGFASQIFGMGYAGEAITAPELLTKTEETSGTTVVEEQITSPTEPQITGISESEEPTSISETEETIIESKTNEPVETIDEPTETSDLTTTQTDSLFIILTIAGILIIAFSIIYYLRKFKH